MQKKAIIWSSILFLVLFGIKSVSACTLNSECPNGECVASVCVSSNTNQSDNAGTVRLNNPLTGNTTATDPNVLIGKIINAVLGIVGSIALAMFIFGGFTWMTAAGGSEKVQKGKDTLVWATIGLIVIFTAYAVVRFVLDGLAGTIP